MLFYQLFTHGYEFIFIQFWTQALNDQTFGYLNLLAKIQNFFH